MAGRSLAECGIRQKTGCNVIAVARGEELAINPDAFQPLPADANLILIGDVESENRFLSHVAEA